MVNDSKREACQQRAGRGGYGPESFDQKELTDPKVPSPAMRVRLLRWASFGRLPPPAAPPLSPPPVVRPAQTPDAPDPRPAVPARFWRVPTVGSSHVAVSPVLQSIASILPLPAAPPPACR